MVKYPQIPPKPNNGAPHSQSPVTHVNKGALLTTVTLSPTSGGINQQAYSCVRDAYASMSWLLLAWVRCEPNSTEVSSNPHPGRGEVCFSLDLTPPVRGLHLGWVRCQAPHPIPRLLEGWVLLIQMSCRVYSTALLHPLHKGFQDG